MTLPTIIITGNLTADPEIRATNNGKQVVNFRVAASHSVKNPQTGQWEDAGALFLNCSAWDGTNESLATNIAQSLRKGMSVIVKGKLSQRDYQTKEGEKRTVMELKVDDIGPSLRRATVQVNRQQAVQSNGFNQAQPNGFNPQSQQPYQAPQAGGFNPGMAPTQQPQGQQPMDPWANNPNGFNAPTEF